MSTRKSLLFSFLDRYAALAIDVVSSMLLARLLTPGDIGVFSVTMTLLAFVSTARDLGAGQYVIQEQELTAARLQAVWAVQLGLGLLLALLVLAASAPMASFYAEPRMESIMWVVALNYAVNPVGSITYAMLMRAMRYDSIAFIRFTGSLAGGATAVGLAWHGYGPMSLAWGNLCATVVTALTSIFFRPAALPWLPGFAELPRVLGFGSRMTLTAVVDSLAKGAPDFFLGKLQGFATAGFYSRANGLVAMFNRLVTDGVYPVALSLFAKESRAEVDMRRSFTRSLSYVTVLAWPFATLACILAHPLVIALYGDQWHDAVPVARLLAIAMALGIPIGLCHSVLVASGAIGKVVKASLSCAAVVLCLVVAGAWHGLPQLGMAIIAGSLASSVIWLAAVKSEIRFHWHDVLKAAAPNPWLCAAVAIAPLSACALWGFAPANPLPSLLLSAVLTPPLFLVTLRFIDHPFAGEMDRLLAGVKRKLGIGKAHKDA